MNAPQLSIIVPVYNVEPYIRRCIESIQTQTFRDFELILIDDGSSDRSGSICDDYARRDSRIRVIHKKNEGAWSARNMGLDHAQGLYIMFADPDDELGTSDTIEKNINILLKQEEISLVQFPSFWFRGQKIDYSPSLDLHYYNSYNSIFHALFNYKISTVLWDKIYDKRIFSTVRLPRLRYYEDSYCMIDILKNTESVIISGQGYYKYCIRDSSAMTCNLSLMKLEDYFHVNFRFMELAQTFNCTDIYRVRVFLEMEDKLAQGKHLLSSNAFAEHCKKLSEYLPNYSAIIHYTLKQDFKKGVKAMIIRFMNLKLFYSLVMRLK